MTKSGKLSTQEKYVIQGMKHEGKTVEEIATFLDRTEKSINTYLNGELDKIHDTVVKTQVQQANKITAKDLMITETDSGRKGAVAIMTKAASEKGDSAKQQYKGRINRIFSKNVVRLSDGKTLEHGDTIAEANDGPLDERDMQILVSMVKQGKNVKNIAMVLNRDENEIAKIVGGL